MFWNADDTDNADFRGFSFVIAGLTRNLLKNEEMLNQRSALANQVQHDRNLRGFALFVLFAFC